MNREKAMTFLKQYDKLQSSCQIINEQMFRILPLLRELKREDGASEAAETVTARVCKYTARLTDEYNDLLLRKMLLKSRMDLIESVVKSLPKTERTVIERFFLSSGKHAAEDLMEELEFEKTQIYRLRSRALDMVAEIISNLPECYETYE